MRVSVAATFLCFLLSSALSSSVVKAQQLPANGGSQRILPLPEGRLSDFQTQMELLQRLRSLVAASDDLDQPSPSSSDSSQKIDDQQLEQLQQALKQLQNQLPPGVTPPDLGSIPKEQLDDAMSDPAVQQQLKKMLEQFSRDGLIPRSNKGMGNSALPPLPRQPSELPNRPSDPQEPRAQPPVPQRDRSTDSSRPPLLNEPKSNDPNASESRKPARNGQRDQSDSGSDLPKGSSSPEKSLQSLKDAMKKLSEIAQGGTSPPRNVPAGRESADSATAERLSTSETPKPKTTGANADDTTAPGSPAGDAETEGASEHRQQSLQAFQDLLERYKNSQQDRNDRSASTGSGGDELPEIRPGAGLPQPQTQGGANNQSSSDRVLRRPDRAVPMEPPLDVDRKMSEQGEVFPPLDPQRRDRLPRESTGETDRRKPSLNLPETRTPGGDPNPSSEPPFSVSEFLKQQLREGIPTPGSQHVDPRSQSKSPNRAPVPPQPGNSARGEIGAPGEANPKNQDAPSTVDIRSELEKRGLRGTLQKIVEKARQESMSQRAQAEQQPLDPITGPSGGSKNSNATGQTADNSAFKKSVQDLLGGLDHRMEDIARDAQFKNRSRDARSQGDSAWQQAPPDSGTSQKSWNDAASNFIKDLSVAPPAPAAAPSSGGGGGSMSVETPFAMGSLLLVSLGLLATVCVIAFLIRRPLLKMVSDATGMTGAKRIVRTNDIRSRDDVIAAFHQLVLNPKQLVEAWWTHRAAAHKLATASPQQEVAVQTLAAIYEQARYLPEDIELPDHQIQSARSALAQCQ